MSGEVQEAKKQKTPEKDDDAGAADAPVAEEKEAADATNAETFVGITPTESVPVDEKQEMKEAETPADADSTPPAEAPMADDAAAEDSKAKEVEAPKADDAVVEVVKEKEGEAPKEDKKDENPPKDSSESNKE